MQIIWDREDLQRYMSEAVRVSDEHPSCGQVLEDALEVECGRDRGRRARGGRRRHGAHREGRDPLGDSACALPPYSLGDDQIERIKTRPARSPGELGVIGVLQHPVRDQERDGLRARGQPARVADRALRLQGHRRAAGQARDQGDAGQRCATWIRRGAEVGHIEVKEAVLPFVEIPRRGRGPGAGDEVHR